MKKLVILSLLIAATASAQSVNICTNSSGNSRQPGCNASNQLEVDVKDLTPGTGATDLGKAEDAAHTSGDTGVAVWGIVQTSPAAAKSVTANDYTGANIDSATGGYYTNPVASTATVCVAITPDNDAAYTPNDVVATEDATDPLSFAAVFRSVVFSGTLNSIQITNTEPDAIGWRIVLFDADPSTSTTTDGAPLAVADADLTKIVGQVSVSDCTSYADNELCQATGIGLAIDGAATGIYAALITPGAPQWAASQTVNVCLTFSQD